MPCFRLPLIATTIICICLGLSGCASPVDRAEKTAPTPIADKPAAPLQPKPQGKRPSENRLTEFLNAGPTMKPPLNLLVLGLDASKQRSDVILAVTIPVKGAVSVVSVPRDTRVLLPGRGYTKINEAYAHGGANSTAKAVEGLLGKSYPHYVTLDFTGLQNLVDTLGGVPINVGQTMKYTDRAGGLYIDIKQGQQTMKGSKAIQYLRFRSDGKGDIGRIKRQQQFMSAWVKTIFAEPSRLLSLVAGLPAGVRTNLKVAETLRLAVSLALSRRQFEFSMLPGKADYVENVSYWIPSRQRVVLGEPAKAQ